MNAHHLTLAQLLDRPLLTLTDDVHVSSALLFARVQHVHHMPVVRGSTLVGLACTCDLQEAAPDSLISEWMKPVITIDGRATPTDAALLMNQQGIGSVIVTVEGQPRGIVTRGDLLRLDPSTEAVLLLARCECCGLTRHLSRDETGATLCIYCGPRSTPAEASCSEPCGAAAAEPAPSLAPDSHALASLIRDRRLLEPLAEALANLLIERCAPPAPSRSSEVAGDESSAAARPVERRGGSAGDRLSETLADGLERAARVAGGADASPVRA